MTDLHGSDSERDLEACAFLDEHPEIEASMAPAPTDVPPHLRGSVSPEEWERICRDPERAEDVRISRWVASLGGER